MKVKSPKEKSNKNVMFQDSESKSTEKDNRLRFQELFDERSRNDAWMSIKNEINEEEIYNIEVKEGELNAALCLKAKEEEMNNFKEYKVCI